MTTKKQTTHDCIYEEQITQMHKIIVGNGDPQHSMVAQMVEMNTKLQYIIDARNRVWPTIFKIIGTLTAIIMVYYGYKNLDSGQGKIQTETKATNEILSPVLRGNAYNPFTVDSIKKKSMFFDTINIDMIINSIK